MKTSKIKVQEILNTESMKLFTMLCGYFLLVLILFTFCQLLNLKNCLGLIQILSITIPLIFYLYSIKNRKNVKKGILTITAYLLLLTILPFIYNKTYDLTYDGNSYHKTAIAFIKNGWNPLYETSRTFQKNNENIIKFTDTDKIDLWIEHYPKATWIIAATIYNMTGNIESGKCLTLIFSIMLFILSFNCLRKIIDKKWGILISVLLVFNPISLAQVFSYYVDSLMGILFSIEIFLLFLVNPREKINKQLWICLMSICLVFVNIKFTGLLCSGVVAAVFYFFWLIENRKEKDYLLIFKRITIAFIIVFSLAIFFIGANSYVKNTIDHSNPLYPLIGEDKVDIITTMQPVNFKGKGMIEKFAISLFSKSENILNDGRKTTLKLPFKIYRSEISELFAPDVRIAGFGPLFALILILSISFFTYLVTTLIRSESVPLKYLLLPIIAMTLTSILVGEIWWARYVPQLYLFPLGTLILASYLLKTSKKKFLKLPITIITIIIFLNVSCYLYVNGKNITYFYEISNDLKELQKQQKVTLKLSGNSDLYGYFYNLKDQNIKYTVDENIENAIYMYRNKFEVKK